MNLEEQPVPLAEMPGNETPGQDVPTNAVAPGKIPQTGVFYWETIIVLMTIFGTLLLMAGLIQKRRNKRKD